MTELILIGTNHFDLRGAERLNKFFTYFKPDNISLEVAPEQVMQIMNVHFKLTEFYELNLHSLEQELPFDNIKPILDLRKNQGYEVIESNNYALEQNTTLWANDKKTDDFFSTATNYAHITKELKYTKLEQLITEIGVEKFQEIIELKYSVLNDVTYTKEECKSFFEDRDKTISTAITNIIQQQKPEVLIHIGGLQHTHGDYFNLTNRLQQFNPRKYKLNEADTL